MAAVYPYRLYRSLRYHFKCQRHLGVQAHKFTYPLRPQCRQVLHVIIAYLPCGIAVYLPGTMCRSVQVSADV